MGLFEEDKTEAKPQILDPDEVEYEKEKSTNRAIVIGSLVVSFIVGFAVAETPRSILDPFIQRLSTAFGATVITLLFAGIPSMIATKLRTKRFVWLAITIIHLGSQIVSFLYEKK